MPAIRDQLIDNIYENFRISSKADSFFVYDIKKDFARCSASVSDTFSVPGEYINNASAVLEEFVHPEDRETFIKELSKVKKGSQSRYFASYRLKIKSGEYVSCDFKVFVVRDYARHPAYLSVTVTNKDRNTMLDTVTDLDSRFEYMKLLREKKDYKKPTISFMVGTTNIMAINRLYGYSVGNKVLRAISDKMSSVFGGRASLFRGQGASVIALTDVMSREEIQKIYTGLRAFAGNKIFINSVRIAVELAAGAVELDDFEIDEHTVHNCAKYALDRSVSERGENIVFIKNDQIAGKTNALAVINTLRQGITNKFDGFYLGYQPIISTLNGKLEGVEALLRYDKKPLGKISPSVFIPVLERDEIFSELGHWIMEQACRDAKELLSVYSRLRLHINLSHVQLEDTRFRRELMEILSKASFPGRNLCVELSEGCKKLSPLFLRDQILFLKGLNIATALDGSCVTSLALIRELPVDMIKVEKEMILNIEQNLPNQYMLEAVTNLADKLRIQVGIEGVETEEAKQFLKRYVAGSYQGYLYSEAVSIDELKSLPLLKAARRQ